MRNTVRSAYSGSSPRVEADRQRVADLVARAHRHAAPGDERERAEHHRQRHQVPEIGAQPRRPGDQGQTPALLHDLSCRRWPPGGGAYQYPKPTGLAKRKFVEAARSLAANRLGFLLRAFELPTMRLVTTVTGAAVDIGERRQANILVLAPVGRIDNLTSTEFQARLLAAVTSGSADVIVDFSGVEYISSAGLRALMTASQMKPKERRLAVARLNAVVHEIFTISRFSHLIPIFATVEEASAAWEAPARSGGCGANADAAPEPAPSLRVRFWGTRGSLPAPLTRAAVRGKIRDALLAARERTPRRPRRRSTPLSIMSCRFRCAAPSAAIPAASRSMTGGDEYLLCDLGTGVREFGNQRAARARRRRASTVSTYSCRTLHWDHIMGFPFFAPAYIPGNRIRIYGCHKIAARGAAQRQQSAPFFPVDFRSLAATIEFIDLEPGRTYEVAGFSVTAIKQFHCGDSYGYRFSRGGEVDRLLYRLRAQIFAHSTNPTRSSSSTGTPIC